MNYYTLHGEIISPHSTAHSCAHRPWTQTIATYIVGLFLCYRLVLVLLGSVQGTKNVLCSYAPRFREQRSDLPRKAGCSGGTRHSCSLKRGISRLHTSLYKNTSMVFAWDHWLLRDELGKLTGSLFAFDYAEEFLGVYVFRFLINLRIRDACGSTDYTVALMA